MADWLHWQIPMSLEVNEGKLQQEWENLMHEKIMSCWVSQVIGEALEDQ
jgi:hypothetical protein